MKLKSTLRAALMLTLLQGPISSPLYAATVALDFDSLPSAQGWQYFGAEGLSEASVFSVSDGVLLQNTVGTGLSGWGAYKLPNAVDFTQPFSIDVRVRILDQENSQPAAFYFDARGPAFDSEVWLTKTQIGISERLGSTRRISIDGTTFHDYRLVVQPDGRYDLLIDNHLQGSGLSNVTGLFLNDIWFGDGSLTNNGQAEITKLVITTVPMPGSAWLFAFGLGALATFAKRRKVLW